MPVSTTLNDLSKLALVASDSSYFTSAHPVLPGSALAPLDEGDPTILPRFDFASGFIARSLFIDIPGIPTGFKAIAYEKGPVGNPDEVILAFGGTDGPNSTDWVSNTQHLGWNQWNENRAQIYQYLSTLPASTKITFTGQSLGGTLAQYAAYEWIRDQKAIAATNNATFDMSRISLVTFNALGGYLGLSTRVGYDPSVLADLNPNQAAHYVITGDLVSRLGGDPIAGIGHVGGSMYLLDYRTVNPETGNVVKVDLIESHRIESGFYAGLHALDAFTVAQNLFSTTSPQQWYLPMASLQNTAGLLGNILNGRDVGRAESVPRLLAGLMAGMTFGNQQEWNTLVKAYLTNQHDAGKLSDGKYAFYTAAILPVTVAGKPVTAAIYTASAILAGLADALGLGLSSINAGLSTLKEFFQLPSSSGPPELTTLSQHELVEKAVLILAATPNALPGFHPFSQELASLNLTPDAFAQQLLTVTGSTWRTDTLAYLRDQSPNPADKVQTVGLAVAFYDALSATPELDPSNLTLFAEERDTFYTDTASGFANAMADFTQKIANVAFNLGQTISSFADIQLIDQAYAAELNDPRLSSSVRTVVEEARDIVQRAGQTVVVQQGIGANPFNIPGFNPDSAPFATGTVREDGANVFTAYLPYAAGTEGQAIRLSLNGLGSNNVTVLSGGQELAPQNGVVTLVIPEGQQQLLFVLRAPDVSANTVLSVNAVLVNSAGTATHVEHQEATVSLVDSTINYDDGRPVMTITSLVPEPDNDHNYIFLAPDGWVGDIALVSGHDQIYGSSLGEFITGGYGHDRIYGGGGSDTILGGSYFLNQEPTPIQFEAADGDDVVDGQGGDDEIEGDGGNDRLYGSDGNDLLFGDAGTYGSYFSPPGGDDLVDGGAGEDFLWGDYGADILVGGDGNDHLAGDYLVHSVKPYLSDVFVFDRTRAKDDFLDGGDGADILYGDGGNDTLVGGTGNDELYGDYGEGAFLAVDGDLTNIAGNDALDGGTGDDFIYGMGGDDVIGGGEGGDVIFGDFVRLRWPTASVFGNDVIDAGAGDDYASGGSGNDILFGGAGNDRLWGDISFLNDTNAVGDDSLDGGAGEDILWGGLGNDRLEGGDGHDILIGTDHYEWNSADHDILAGGAGDDRIYGQGGNDVLGGGEGTDILFGDDYYFVDQVPGPNVLNQGLFQSLVYTTAPGNDVLDGGAGDDFLAGGAGNDILFGGSGNDFLYGDSGQSGVGDDDRLTGGLGHDVLDGGGGNDIYEFNLGDGSDDVSDSGQSNDTILFGSGITSSSVTLTSDSGRIFVKVGAGLDGILLGGVGDVFGSQTIEQFQFADGATLTYADLIARGFDVSGTANNDVLFGTDMTNRLRGGLGNDTLFGGLSEDTYFFNSGDGVDLIIDSSTPNGRNTVVFGPGITATQLTLGVADDLDTGQANVLVIRTGNGADAIQLKNLDRHNVFGPHAVDSFQFADGSRLSYEQLLSRGFDLVGTADSDNIHGTNITDRITAEAGDDQVRAGAGDDLLDGGAGDDQLRGESGNDTYMFGLGSGHDRILDEQGTADIVRLAPGIVSSNVAVTRSGDDLVIRLNQGADQLTVAHHFLLPMFRIEEIQFSDGSALTSAFLDSPIIQGTQQSDVLEGTAGDDVLVGLGGGDQIVGLAGHDVLDGGTGADVLTGNLGNDTYIIRESGDVVIEAADEGMDTIQSSITYTLGANLEHLTLIGNAAVNGTGNDLDNVLTGNSAANALTGGQGNDTYVLSAGDTVVELAGEGIDTVQTGSSVTLEANVENLTVTGSALLTGTGNELDNVLQADGSISVLAGGDGNDTYLIGPNGDDDILVETSTGGIDTAIAAHNYRLPANIENLTVLDPRVPDFETFSLIPYGSPGIVVTGYGNDLDNTIIGGRANNVLDGGVGADTLIGGAGDDTYVVDHPNDVVVEQANEGVDTVQSSVTYTLSAVIENLTLTGTASINGTGNALTNDMRGNDASNVLDGGAGDDGFQGLGGADTYLFGRGADSDTVFDFSVAGEVDTIQLASDVAPADIEVYRRDFSLVLVIPDTTSEIILGSFFDQPEYAQKQVRFADGTVWNEAELRARAVDGGPIFGTTGNDTLSGGAGHRVLIGNAGNDILTGGNWDDVLYGDAQSSGLQVFGDDTLIGGAGDDTLIDFRGMNLFSGGAGNDTLVLGTGVDTVLFGRGSGIDAVTLDNSGSDLDIIQMAAGISPADVVMTRPSSPLNNIVDLLISDSGDRMTLALSTNFFAVGPETTQAVVRFIDGTQWSLKWAAPIPSLATGTPFDDVVNGLPGEVLRGLAGNDTYSVGAVSGPVIELPGEGTDTVQSTVDYMLPANVENVFLANNSSNVGSFADNATGNEGDNLIIGNTRDNVLDGGAGNDVLVGGFFLELEGPPYVRGTGSDILIGGEGDDVLMADGGNVVSSGGALFLDGGSGFREDVPREADDLFIGGIGNDTYILHSQQQTVEEFANEGTDTVRCTVDYVLGNNVENLTLLENLLIFLPGPFLGTGNELDNVLIGNSENNVLSGGNGNDTLWGGSGLYRDSEAIRSGSDLLIGGTGNDTYLFKLGDGIDTIQDASELGAGNRLQFGVGIAQTDLTFTQDQVARTLTIQVGSSGTDQLLLTNFDPTGANGSLVVDTLAFADGSTANLAALLGGPVNHAPTVANPLADQTVPEDALFSVVVPSNTFADEDAGDVLTLSVSMANESALPAWLSFNPTTRTFSGTPDDAQVGTLDLRVTATDHENLSVSDVFRLAVTNVNEAPIVAVPLANQTALEDIAFTFAVPGSTFTDVDLGDVLTYSATLADGTALPTWLSFDPITSTFSGTPGNTEVGTLALAVTATDQSNLSASTGFTLTIQNVNDAPTVATPLPDQTAAEDSAFTLTIPTTTFADEDVIHGDVLTYGATLADGSPLPAWLSFNSTTRTFSGTPLNSNVGTLALRVTATDTGNLSASDTFSLTVTNVNNAPTVTNPVADQTAAEDTALTMTIPSTTFADEDLIHGDVLTYSATLGNGSPLPAWLSFNSTTRTFSGTPGAGDAGSLQIAVTATDSGNLSATDQFALAISGPLPQTVIGTAGNDVLTGGRGDDTLTGLAGNDTLQGGAGNDLLDGGTGTDTMQGGTGNDIYVLDVAGDVVTELANAGTDTVQSSITATLGANVEHLTLTGTANLNGTGNVLDNILTGNSGTNVLTGGAGNDTYVVGAGDTVVENAGGGTDTVQSSVAWTLSLNVENLILTGTANINGTGSSANNVLVGNSGNNTLDSGSGNDTVGGGDGNDSLLGGSGNDTLLGGLGTDTLNAGSGNDFLNGGDGTDTLDGGSGDDQLLGGAGNDTLTGGSGADQFAGGTGNETLTGGSGNDLYNFSRGDGQDTIIDSDPFPGNQDRALFGATINPLDLVISRQANDLRLAIHGSSDQITVQNWYVGTNNRIETLQAGNGQTLLSTQVDQLIQAMAGFTTTTGLSWDAAIAGGGTVQQQAQFQGILAASWQ